MIEISNLNLYISSTQVLKDISLKLEPQKLTVLFGKSGSGKSSLLRCIPNLTPYNGTILLDGVDTKSLAPHKLRRRVLYISQSPSLPEPTVKENLLAAFRFKSNNLPEPSDKDLEDALLQLKLPIAYLSKKPENLSGGERQRVHIAKSLLLNPEWLLLDEPTSAQDIKTQESIITAVKEISKSVGVLVVSHSLDMIYAADVKIMMSAGTISGIWGDDITIEHIRSVISDEE